MNTDREQEEFLRKYYERNSVMRKKHRKLRRIVKTVIGITIGVIVISVLMKVGILLLM